MQFPLVGNDPNGEETGCPIATVSDEASYIYSEQTKVFAHHKSQVYNCVMLLTKCKSSKKELKYANTFNMTLFNINID